MGAAAVCVRVHGPSVRGGCASASAPVRARACGVHAHACAWLSVWIRVCIPWLVSLRGRVCVWGCVGVYMGVCGSESVCARLYVGR